jgi:hypothetical protein
MSILSEQGTGPRSKLPMHLQRAVTLLAMSRIPSSARKIKGVVDVSIQIFCKKLLLLIIVSERRKTISFHFVLPIFHIFFLGSQHTDMYEKTN